MNNYGRISAREITIAIVSDSTEIEKNKHTLSIRKLTRDGSKLPYGHMGSTLPYYNRQWRMRHLSENVSGETGASCNKNNISQDCGRVS